MDLVTLERATLETALAHHQAGRHAHAAQLYRDILADDPAEPTALYLAGLLDYEMGRIGPARSRLAALVAVRPGHVASQMALANLHLLERDDDAAIGCFSQVLALDPAHVATRNGLLRALLAAGRPAAALAAAEAALQPDNGLLGAGQAGDGLLDAGQAGDGLSGAGQAGDGLSGAGQALGGRTGDSQAVGGHSGDAWLLRGIALKGEWRLAEAAVALRRAIALEPGRASAHLTLGNVCAELDLFAEAERHLRLAVACDPACAAAQAGLGSVLLLTGRIASAERWLLRAVALDPQLVAAHRNLAAICAEGRRHVAACQHRDLAYRCQNIFVETAAAPAVTVLLPITASGGNVPTQFLLPRETTTRIAWVAEYATADQDRGLPPHDLVFNAMGDPDYAGEMTPPLARIMAGAGRPVLNDPARVARTRRDLLPRLLSGVDGIVVPAVRRLPPGPVPADPGLGMPVLLRPAGSHGGREILRADTLDAWREIRIAGPEDSYATEFVDYRSPDGYFRKYRFIFIDRVPHALHLAIGSEWVVHYVTADMLSDAGKCAEEHRFLADPAAIFGPAAMTALAQIGKTLDLDFCGADVGLLPDGRVLVFEANATMLVAPEDDQGPFAYKNRSVKAILRAFDRMIETRMR